MTEEKTTLGSPQDSQQDSPLVSVLVPIYNVERYLEKCLDSILNQTLTNFEAILINDGSTDGSRDIVQRYLDRDGRFVVIDKENSGYGASMNMGLDRARGTYVAILESDDFYEPDALEKLYDAAEQSGAEVAKANFWLYWSQPEERKERCEVVLPEMAGRVCRPLDDPDKTIFYQMPSIWSAIYRRDFLRRMDIRFLETPGASFQDNSFFFKVWALADWVVYIDDCVMFYRQDNEGSSIHDPGKVYCVCDEYAEINRFLEQHPAIDKALRGVYERMKFDMYMWNAGRLSDELVWEFLDRAREELLEDWSQGRIDQSILGVYKRTDLRYLLEDPESFKRAFSTYGSDDAATIVRHYLELGGPILVFSMFTSTLKKGRV